MKQITILSGKGGTGKTSLTAAYASLADNAVMADCDVDAADLFLILNPENVQEEVFLGGETAVIDPQGCINCGRCPAICRFDAIYFTGTTYEISPYKCDGCALCTRFCPTKAITMVRSDKSRWYSAETRFGPMVYARLGIAEENSGKLVTMVRHQAKLRAESEERDFVLIDGPPGIGCPTTSSLSGVDLAVVVTEPTQSGRHDLERVLDTVEHFGSRSAVIINKADINPEMTLAIEDFCRGRDVPLLAKIPFAEDFVKAMVAQKTLIEHDPKSELSSIVRQSWQRITEELMASHEA